MDPKHILAKIERRLGFVPPFFAPAADHPEVLASLWQQTESAYLDNALPVLFKEKLAALLGRYCEIPYCLVCHTCTLRPLGMSGPSIVELLTQPHPSNADVSKVLARWDSSPDAIDLTALDRSTEADLFVLACAVYFGGPLAAPSRQRLRRRLARGDYQRLIVFTSYNKTCHEWMAAHPEVSFEIDQRYLQHYAPLVDEAPAFAALFATPHEDVERAREQRSEAVVVERSAEAHAQILVSERRYVDVLLALEERIAAAKERGADDDALTKELCRAAHVAKDLLSIVAHDARAR